MTTDNDLAAQLAALQATVADLKAQCDNLYKKHGYPSWEIEKKQRADNQKAAATKLPFNVGDLVYRPKPHEAKND